MHVAIIGNGVAGVSAALRLREKRPEWRITMVSGESTYHWSRPALMYVFMGHMRYRDTKPFPDGHWRQQRIELVRDWVTDVDAEGKKLTLQRSGVLPWDKLLIATGGKPNRFGWKGEDLDGVQGMWGLPDLKRLLETVPRTRHAVVVGGGLIGIELAEMLHSRGVPVTFLVREASYWNNVLPPEESAMVNGVIRRRGFDLRLATELREIVDDGDGRVGAVVTSQGERIDCQLVGLTAGVSPHIDLLHGTTIETGRGVLVDSSLRASVPDVFAAGDCAEIVAEGEGPHLLSQVWYTGKMQGELAADVMAGEPRAYDPGIWFNSARFLDLEYQTYGRVGRGVPGEENLYWEDEGGGNALRLVHVGDRVIGINAMGLRLRHEVCERWLAEEACVEHVLAGLEEANFDPEFYRRHEPSIRCALAGRAGVEGAV